MTMEQLKVYDGVRGLFYFSLALQVIRFSLSLSLLLILSMV